MDANFPLSTLHAPLSVIISGGGTGGHVYPAIAIADALQKRVSNVSILFVGAEGRMEMEKVPAAGYKIIGLPVVGLQRTRWWKNFSLPFKIWKNLRRARKIINDFQPDIVVGVGGYASAPILQAAQRKKIPTILQEQNSYPGIANKVFARNASAICVAYDGMERFFPKEKIILTGNPVRFTAPGKQPTEDQPQPAEDQQQPTEDQPQQAEHKEYKAQVSIPPVPLPAVHSSMRHADCPPPRKPETVLIVGGSLGAYTLNDAMEFALPILNKSGIHFIWQTGKAYYESAKAAVDRLPPPLYGSKITVTEFISRMDEAFAAADIVISRAGASTISELCIAAKACIFVPSPNVAEDHQTKNAQALVAKNAALMIRDDEVIEKLWPEVLKLLLDKARIRELEKNIALLAKPNAANDIVDIIMKYSINKYRTAGGVS